MREAKRYTIKLIIYTMQPISLIGCINKQLIKIMKGMVKMFKGIQQWYVKAYPSDDLGYNISEQAVFVDLHDGIMNGYDIYGYLGISDSLVRERIFLELASIYDTSYKNIYETWINNLK